MKLVILFLSYLTLVRTGSVPFQDCGSNYHLTTVEVENCKYLPCPVWMETNTQINVTLIASFYSKQLTEEIIIKTQGINNRGSSTPRACESSRNCPINDGDDASFSVNVWVPDIAPLKSTLQWILTNENGNKVMCFILNVLLCDHRYPNNDCYQ